MGHLLALKFPSTPAWRGVVALLEADAPVDRVARASAKAAKAVLKKIGREPAVIRAVKLLIEAPIAARRPDAVDALKALDVEVSEDCQPVELAAALGAALDRAASVERDDSDLGQIARRALTTTILEAVGRRLPSLFEAQIGDTLRALGELSRTDRFGELCQRFFGSLVSGVLDAFLSRELANHIGPGRRFETSRDRRAFDQALELQCRRIAEVVRDYAPGWLGKTLYHDGEITDEKLKRFVGYASVKLRRAFEALSDG